MESLRYESAKTQLVLNRSNAFTGINVANAESALGRKIDFEIINEYRSAIAALNSGAPFMASRPDGPAQPERHELRPWSWTPCIVASAVPVGGSLTDGAW